MSLESKSLTVDFPLSDIIVDFTTVSVYSKKICRRQKKLTKADLRGIFFMLWCLDFVKLKDFLSINTSLWFFLKAQVESMQSDVIWWVDAGGLSNNLTVQFIIVNGKKIAKIFDWQYLRLKIRSHERSERRSARVTYFTRNLKIFCKYLQDISKYLRYFCFSPPLQWTKKLVMNTL